MNGITWRTPRTMPAAIAAAILVPGATRASAARLGHAPDLPGGTVVGAVQKRCLAPFPDAVPWLLLGAASHDGVGVFRDVAFIRRVHTVGGAAPTDPGTAVGELRDVPYSAEYFFYRDR